MSDTPTYQTRYGIKTADEAAQLLLDRSWSKLRFLEDVLRDINPDGDGVALEGYSNLGLACILEDIAHDVSTVYSYHSDDEDTPGRVPTGRFDA